MSYLNLVFCPKPVTNLLIELCASFLEVNHNFAGGESEITPRGGRGMVKYLERTEGKPPKWDIQENLMEPYENFMEPIVKTLSKHFWTIMVVIL